MKTPFNLRLFYLFPLYLSVLLSQAQSLSGSQSTSASSDPAKDSTQPIKREIYRGSNTRSSDIIHTKLEVTFDWNLSRMNGRASIQVKPYFYPTQLLYLNAKGMDIRSIEVFETAKVKTNPPATKNTKLTSTYIYENDSLKINLGKIFTADQTYTVVIDYVAKPNELKAKGGSNAISDDKGLYFINPKGENPFKMPQIWTQGETQANSVWFPTIDSPNEKMTQEIYITVDQKYTTLSNGTLVSSKLAAGGTRTDYWKMDQPHSPYLVMMAIGEFKKVVDAPWNGKEISYYVEKEYEPHAKAIFGDTKEMIEFYSKRLGVPYPWAKYAQIAVRDYVSGAMENTSATLHGDFVVYQTTRETIDGKKGNSVIAHELFHQWFGDLVTCESWSNLPLNESFATYATYLWDEYKSGRDEADYNHYQSKQGYMSSEKNVDLIRFNYADKEDMFDSHSYNKGGQILHMLRKTVGDDAFFAALKNYLETNKYKSAEIHHLRLAFEETTGRDMNWFFNQWFLNKGRPKIRISKVYNSNTQQVELTIEQLQDLKKAPLYQLPLEVDLYSDGKSSRKHIEITDQKQTFLFAAATEPRLVNFDPERQLLCDLEYTKTIDEYLFQYKNAPLCEDRLEALKNLESKINEPNVYALFKDAAQNDKFYQLRNYAIGKLEKTAADQGPELKALFTQIYTNDQKTLTRAKALGALNRRYNADVEVAELNEKALNEQSYAICSEALEAIAKSSPTLAMQKAKALENENGKVLFSVANIYGTQGGDDQIAFFHNAMKKVNGFEMITFCNGYTKAAKRSVKTENVLLAAKDLELVAKTGSKYTKYAAVKGLKELTTVWEEKENNLKKSLEVTKSGESTFAEIDKELQRSTELKEKLSSMYNGVK